MNQPDEKKERVLHARISDSLDQELKERASSLGVSVSNLVRNVLARQLRSPRLGSRGGAGARARRPAAADHG